MSDIQTTVESYIATWSEPDPEIRREAVAELWAEDAFYRNQFGEYHGRAGIERAVGEAYELFATRGFTFTVDRIDVNHDVVRWVWHVLPPGGGAPEAVGTQVVSLDADGRMVRDHQFVDRAPAAMAEALAPFRLG
jgi:SnoaL-like domain